MYGNLRLPFPPNKNVQRLFWVGNFIMTPCVDSCFFPPGTSKKLPPLKPPGFPAKWTRICFALGTCLGGWRLVSAGSRCCRRCLNKMRGSILQEQIGNHFGNYRFLKAPDWSRHKIMISLKVQESGEKILHSKLPKFHFRLHWIGSFYSKLADHWKCEILERPWCWILTWRQLWDLS